MAQEVDPAETLVIEVMRALGTIKPTKRYFPALYHILLSDKDEPKTYAEVV